LQHIDNIGKALEQLAPYESMAISDRTIVFRDQVFSIESGRTFEALPKSVTEGRAVLSSDVVEFSDKVVFRLLDSHGVHLVYKNDPGRRDCSLVGYRVLNLVQSANMINSDTMLF